MEKAIFTAWAKAQYAKQAAKDAMSAKLASAKRAFCEEDGGSEGIIIAIILIIIAVSLAIIFRNEIGTFVNKLFNQVDSEAEFGVTRTSGES